MITEQNLIDMIDYASNIIHNDYNDDINRAIINFSNQFKTIKTPKQIENEKKEQHSKYPIPDPEHGRPRIEWNECYHAYCHKRFNSGNELVRHLQEYNAFTSGMHKAHEEVVDRLNLNEQTILSGRYTRCPSYVCSKGCQDMTPEELIYHFTMLGISPFWQKGMNLMQIAEKENEINISHNVVQLTGKMYSNTDVKCAICCENEIQIIFLPCFHYYICLHCSEALNTNKCPICRKYIVHKLPF